MVLLRGCGQCLDVPTFQQQSGLKGFMIAPTCVIKGVGMTIGLEIVEVKGANGWFNTNLRGKMEAAA